MRSKSVLFAICLISRTRSFKPPYDTHSKENLREMENSERLKACSLQTFALEMNRSNSVVAAYNRFGFEKIWENMENRLFSSTVCLCFYQLLCNSIFFLFIFLNHFLSPNNDDEDNKITIKAHSVRLHFHQDDEKEGDKLKYFTYRGC